MSARLSVSTCQIDGHWPNWMRIDAYLLLSGLHTIMRLALATGEALTCFTELVRRAWQADFMVAAIATVLGLLEGRSALRALGKVHACCLHQLKRCSQDKEPYALGR